jgi:hypothetical protein
MNGLRIPVVVLVGGLSCGACSGGGSPAQPNPAQSNATSGSVRATNTAPSLVLRTVPPMNTTTSPYPTVQGVVPLAVRFNLCPSGDPDTSDSLNWQFNFGDTDSKTPAFLPNGAFNPDFEQFCRVDHTYNSAGSYTATLSVTDKHQEDQSRGVSALARTTQFITINAFAIAPPPPGAPTIQASILGNGCTPWTISWTTTNATSVTIKNGPALVGTFPPNGSTSYPSGLATFTLTATGPGGTASAVVVGVFVCD